MYSPWLKAPTKPVSAVAEHSLGKSLKPRARRIAVAIIGLDEDVAEKTRQHLYATAWSFGKLTVRDLGDIRKKTADFLIPLLRELHSAKITPILLGGSDQQLFTAQYLAFGELNRQVSLVQVDRTIDLSPEEAKGGVLDKAVHRKSRKKQFHISHIGAQQHLINPAVYNTFDARGFEAVRLGQAQANISALEPQIRDGDLLGLNISAINHNEAPARAGFHPSGFSLQEATQLAYYAGNSDKLSSFGLFGFTPDAQHNGATQLTAAAYAQLVWYFLHGYSHRVGDFPAGTKGLVEYIVDISGFEQLTFWKSRRSNRWWVEVPDGKYKGEERHRLVPCSYQDYLSASAEQSLPDRLLQAFRRYA